MVDATTPPDMAEVSKADFFAALHADPRDIMPDNSNETFTFWLVVRTRAVWGWSSPGWRNPGGVKVYALGVKTP